MGSTFDEYCERSRDACCEVIRAVSRALRHREPQERGSSRAGAFAIRRFAVSRPGWTMGIESESSECSAVGAVYWGTRETVLERSW